MGRLKTNREKQLKKGNNVMSNHFRAQQPMSIAPGILPGVAPGSLKGVSCKGCGSTRFIPTVELRYANRFQTEVGQPTIVSFQGGFTCAACGKTNEFSAEGMNTKEDQEKETGKQLIN